MDYKKKLIEVALPLDAINQASGREKSIRFGHPSTLHLWWARRPLAAARAIIFSQLIDDPSSNPDLFPSEQDQEKERQRIFRMIEEMVVWENTTNEKLFEKIKEEIRTCWKRTCNENTDNPDATELYNDAILPAFHDPFAGGGALPLEAQRLGLESYASDLNPVAVLINKAIIEIPPKLAGKPPINQESRKQSKISDGNWTGLLGLTEDIKFYSDWMREEVFNRIGHIYPDLIITKEVIDERPDLKPLLGKGLPVIAWLWARTVRSPNPAFRDVEVPLLSTYILSKKSSNITFLEPVIHERDYEFKVKTNQQVNINEMKKGTKLSRGANFKCIMTGAPISSDYIKNEGQAGRLGMRLVAVVVKSEHGRIYLSPNLDCSKLEKIEDPTWKPEQDLQGKSADQLPLYGFKKYSQLYTPRQLLTLSTYSNIVNEVYELVLSDFKHHFINEEKSNIETEASIYANAVALYCGLAVSKMSDYNSMCVVWSPGRDQAKSTFTRQALQMVWDFCEINPFAKAAGDLSVSIDGIIRAIKNLNSQPSGNAIQINASKQNLSKNKIISTDPPYFDNICYADLSDFFYVWLRPTLRNHFTDLFGTLSVPKEEELIASAYRHESKLAAERFFLGGMTEAMRGLSDQSHPAFPVTIYYAYKQSETANGKTTSTGWESFLEALMSANFIITGTWPIRTEREGRTIEIGTNALASSIVLVCRKRLSSAGITTRRDFQKRLRNEMPIALRTLQKGNIAPVDLAQSSIGPGMAIFSEYRKVIEANGEKMSVRTALEIINDVLDEILTEQEGELDSETRWAVAWYEQYGTGEGPFGVAETLSKAKNTSLQGLKELGIVESRSGRVNLLRRSELENNWNPDREVRLSIWETTQRLIKILENEGEEVAASVLGKLGGVAEQARELAYRLYLICERKGWAEEARSYNGLVVAWPELSKLASARQGIVLEKGQQELPME